MFPRDALRVLKTLTETTKTLAKAATPRPRASEPDYTAIYIKTARSASENQEAHIDRNI